MTFPATYPSPEDNWTHLGIVHKLYGFCGCCRGERYSVVSPLVIEYKRQVEVSSQTYPMTQADKWTRILKRWLRK